MSSYIPQISVESPFDGPFANHMPIQYAATSSLRSQDVPYSFQTSDQMTAENGVSSVSYYIEPFWRTMTPPTYTPSNAQYEDLPSPSSVSDASAQEYANQHYDTQQDQSFISHSHGLNSPATPSSPFDSMPPTPKSEEQVAANLSDNYSYHAERPNICVDTALLVHQPSHYETSAIGSASQEASPGLLSPHTIVDTKPLQRRHSHSRSAGHNNEFDLGNVSLSARLGRGHHRNKSAPTSRHHSPYQRIEIAKNVSNIRSISPTSQHTSGSLYSSKDLSPISPSDSIGKQVATERIRNASTHRRKYQPNCYCEECGDTFTTNFARERHMKSHTGERNFVCTKDGCGQKFTTDSGRKRHEKSKTLHTASY